MKRAGHGASRFFTSAPPLYHVSAHWELLPTVYIRGSVATSWLNSSYSTILTGTLMSWNCKKKKKQQLQFSCWLECWFSVALTPGASLYIYSSMIQCSYWNCMLQPSQWILQPRDPGAWSETTSLAEKVYTYMTFDSSLLCCITDGEQLRAGLYHSMCDESGCRSEMTHSNVFIICFADFN